MSEKWAIGVDLGGTKIKCAHVDANGIIQNEHEVPTDVEGGPDAIEKQIEDGSQQLIDEAETAPEALGVGVAGQVVDATGTVRYAPNLDWHDVPLGKMLEEPLGIPVSILNDVRAATWGEWLHGAGKGYENLICIFVGTGVGGGIVSQGQMVSGAANSAGEIGHLTVKLGGPECRCGNLGCLEALAGSWAIERDAKALLQSRNTDSAMRQLADGDRTNLKARHVIQAYGQQDQLATEIMDGVMNALAGGITGLVNVLNPQRIILGGGVAEHTPDLIKKVENNVRQRALDAALSEFDMVTTELHDDSGVVGAAAVTFHK